MKSVFLILGMILSTQAWATSQVVREVHCTSFESGDQVKIERIESEGDSSFKATYTSKDSKTTQISCLSSAANVPMRLRCEGSNDTNQEVLVEVSSVDGILNMGGVSVNGMKENLLCFLSWSH
jgi:hypothetical protein